jgi:hypothetical protein
LTRTFGIVIVINNKMRLFAPLFLLCLTLPAADLPPLIPYYKYVQTLVASADLDDKNYLMVPVLLRVSESDLLVGYKRGYSHYNDREADFEILHLNPVTQRVSPDKIDLRQPELNFQNGEFARFANGEIACYLDVQASGTHDKKPQAVRLVSSNIVPAMVAGHFMMRESWGW